MPHFSLVTLPRNSLKWRFLRPYELHQILWRGFPGLKRGEEKNRFLYRHNEEETHHSILVQSITEPDWSFLADEADGTTVETRPFDPDRIPTDTPLRFLLRANPVVNRKYPDGKTRRIVVGSDRKRIRELTGVADLRDIPTREDLLTTWLQRQGETGGFRLESLPEANGERVLCDVGPNHDLIIRKPEQKKKDERVTVTTVDFSGVLRVTDSDRFAVTLGRGIGRARGFGCGLLSVARL